MDSNDMQRNFSCVICDQLAVQAVQGQCCGILLCGQCYKDHTKKSNICPICRAQQYKARQSLRLRMIIKNIKVECKIGCGARIQNKLIEAHQKECKMITSIIKQPGKQVQIIKDLVLISKSLTFQNFNSNEQYLYSVAKQQLQVNIKYIFQQVAIYLLAKLKSKHSQSQKNFWQLFGQGSQNLDLIYDLSLIYCHHRNYPQSLRYLLRLPPKYWNNRNIYFCIYSLITNYIHIRQNLKQIVGVNAQDIKNGTEINKKQDNASLYAYQIYKFQLEQYQLIILQYRQKLNAAKPIQLLIYAFCTCALIELSYLLKNQQHEIKYTIQYSQIQFTLESQEQSKPLARIPSICSDLFLQVCWLLHVNQEIMNQRLKANSQNRLELSKDINMNQQEIKYMVKLILLILKFFNKQDYFYQLLNQTENLCTKNQIFQHTSKRSLTQYKVSQSIYQIFTSLNPKILPITQYLTNSQLIDTESAFQLYCFFTCHKQNKFANINEDQRGLHEYVGEVATRLYIHHRRSLYRIGVKQIRYQSVIGKDLDQEERIYRGIERKLNLFFYASLKRIGVSNINRKSQLMMKRTLLQLYLVNYPDFSPQAYITKCLKSQYYENSLILTTHSQQTQTYPRPVNTRSKCKTQSNSNHNHNNAIQHYLQILKEQQLFDFTSQENFKRIKTVIEAEGIWNGNDEEFFRWFENCIASVVREVDEQRCKGEGLGEDGGSGRGGKQEIYSAEIIKQIIRLILNNLNQQIKQPKSQRKIYRIVPDNIRKNSSYRTNKSLQRSKKMAKIQKAEKNKNKQSQNKKQ